MPPFSAKSASIPAPVGGWDKREALADMPQDRAVILDNRLSSARATQDRFS